MMVARRSALAAAALAGALAVAGCSSGSDSQGGSGGGGKHGGSGGGGGQPGQGTPEVGFIQVQASSAPIVADLSGRTAAFETSDVRPQVNGIIRRRFFTEGALVRKGQPLYEIDPRLYRAAVNEARANLTSAQANAEATRVQAERYRPLAQIEAVSKQDYTNAVATARQAQASVGQTSAALDTARINLQFTTVPAPISGRIGRSLFTVGALVSASQTDPLAQIQRLDPIFVDIQQSASDLLSLRRSLSQNGVVPTRAVVHLKLEDGSDYDYTGSVEFAEAVVDQSTGTVTLRARFPNPQGLLLPGMFVRATFAQAINTNAFLVPQPAVNRDPQGNATIMVVGPGNKVVQKQVQTDRTQGQYWVVTSGVSPSDKIIIQGLGKLRAGQQVKPVPANTPQRIAPPQNGKGGGGGAGNGGTGQGGKSGQGGSGGSGSAKAG